MFSLRGKRVLVTGASAGIGGAVCRAVADLGGCVIASGRDAGRLEALVGSLPGSGHRSVPADLVEEAGRSSLTEEAGEIDGVVHGAGQLKLLPFAFLQEAALREIQAINYEAPLLLTQLLLKKKKLRSGASIVFVTSVAGQSGAKGHALYSGTKGALEAAARCLALEVAGKRIRVNCVAPGMVRTAMAGEATDGLGEEAMRRHEAEYPLGFGQPEDVTGAVVFCCPRRLAGLRGPLLSLTEGS